jgi:hypothetical protein
MGSPAAIAVGRGKEVSNGIQKEIPIRLDDARL